MKITVCELPAEPAAIEGAWERLASHLESHRSDLLVLPEMAFTSWLAVSDQVNPDAWAKSMDDHATWIERLGELGVGTVVGTRPIVDDGRRFNEGFVWAEGQLTRAHRKTYLPDEECYWERSWYERGPTSFEPVDTPVGRIGFLICSELWFPTHARDYGLADVDLVVCPRATPDGSIDAWLAAGRVAAVSAGAFCASSNHVGHHGELDMEGAGFVCHPEDGEALAVTNPTAPAVTVDIDLDDARTAKSTYPRYIDTSPVATSG